MVARSFKQVAEYIEIYLNHVENTLMPIIDGAIAIAGAAQWYQAEKSGMLALIGVPNAGPGGE